MEQRQDGASAAAPGRRARQLWLPPGFAALRSDLGAIIQQRRVSGGYGRQADVAAQVGIAAENLSRIERGHAVPRLRTLDALLVVLGLGWPDVAIKDAGWVPDAKRAASRRLDRILDAGCEIGEARRAAGWTLRDLARRSGLSLAQISRVEHGQSGGARVYADHPEDAGLPRDQRRLVLVNPALAELVGWFRSERD